MNDYKVICGEWGCDWFGLLSDMQRAPNPFEAGDILHGCPDCNSIDNWLMGCDEPGCNKESTIGEPTTLGYRLVCRDHSVFARNKPADQKGTPEDL